MATWNVLLSFGMIAITNELFKFYIEGHGK
jgi:hypothetical protein